LILISPNPNLRLRGIGLICFISMNTSKSKEQWIPNRVFNRNFAKPKHHLLLYIKHCSIKPFFFRSSYFLQLVLPLVMDQLFPKSIILVKLSNFFSCTLKTESTSLLKKIFYYLPWCRDFTATSAHGDNRCCTMHLNFILFFSLF
jgi:hypothetical protein